jgi:hypothetical protein
VKLGAIRAPVRLRILHQKADNTLVPLQATVEVRRLSFKGDEGVFFKGGSQLGSGLFTTEKRADVPPYDRAAFITIRHGDKVRALLPLPLVDDQTVPVVVRITTERADALAERFDKWQREVDDAWLAQVYIFEDLKDMAVKAGTAREKIVERAEAGLKRTSDDFDRLNQEKEQLAREPGGRRGEMKRLESVLRELKKGETMLQEFTSKQKKALQEESKPERKAANAQLIDAQLAEQRADYDQAIKLYRAGLKQIEDEEKKKHFEKLEKDWDAKGEEHEKARKFIYETWPKLDTAGLDRDMDKAKKALQQFKEVRDYLSPKKLILATNTHLSRLQKEVQELNPALNEGDENPAKRVKKVITQLQQLYQEALAFVSSAKDEE